MLRPVTRFAGLLSAGALSAVLGACGSAAPHTGASSESRSVAAADSTAPSTPHVTVPASAAKLLGQRLMVGFSGMTPSAALLAEIRAGEIGAVILFGENLSTRDQVEDLTGTLQRAARAGGNPPLLIAIDQEGGEVSRLTAGPPDLSPPQMVSQGPPTVAQHEGEQTGSYLKGLGINMDLAPVLDVPTSRRAFIARQGRAFSSDPDTTAAYGSAFALGLQTGGVAATGKHFPGLGSALTSTDDAFQQLTPTSAQRAGALRPYQALIPQGLDAVLVSIAGYRAYDPAGEAAAFSPKIIGGLLRGQLGFNGVVLTDSLAGPTGSSETVSGVRAAHAGADILLYSDSAAGVLGALETALARGTISRSSAEASYVRIVALKRKLAS